MVRRFAEMDAATKNTISHRYKALAKVKEFLKSNPQVLYATVR